MELDKYPVVHPQVASRTVEGSAIIVLADTGQVKMFNPVGTRVWELADGKRSVRDIVSSIVEEFAVDYPEAERDVLEFLQQLVEAQALSVHDQPINVKQDA
jgi:hypothetical protein